MYGISRLRPHKYARFTPELKCVHNFDTWQEMTDKENQTTASKETNSSSHKIMVVK